MKTDQIVITNGLKLKMVLTTEVVTEPRAKPDPEAPSGEMTSLINLRPFIISTVVNKEGTLRY